MSDRCSHAIRLSTERDYAAWCWQSDAIIFSVRQKAFMKRMCIHFDPYIWAINEPLQQHVHILVLSSSYYCCMKCWCFAQQQKIKDCDKCGFWQATSNSGLRSGPGSSTVGLQHGNGTNCWRTMTSRRISSQCCSQTSHEHEAKPTLVLSVWDTCKQSIRKGLFLQLYALFCKPDVVESFAV